MFSSLSGWHQHALVVGLAAVRLGTDEAFMSKLAEWCKTEDHEGVRG